MNDNDDVRDELTKILESFSPNYTQSLRRLALTQNELLPLRFSVCFSFLVPSAYLTAFRDAWLSGDTANVALAVASVISIAVSVWGYRSLRRMDRLIGHWKAVFFEEEDKRLLGTKWVFVPLEKNSGDD